MKPAELFRRLDRTQRSRGFKITASAAIVVLLIVGLIAVYATTAGTDRLDRVAELREAFGEGSPAAQLLSNANPFLEAATMAGIAAALVIGVVWLGLGITYLGLTVVGVIVATPLLFFDQTEVYGRVVLGVIALTFAFTVLMQVLRILLSGSGAVAAVARNVLNEAVRLNISLVFIVLLILGLAVLPSLLNDASQLRYRVQSFLQYATGGTFWIIALLTLFFSVSTVAAEQRDKIIWQTATKPVPAWKYLLGKWVGVLGLNAVLLLVASTGTFMFVEYLRSQPAQGEQEAYVADGGGISDDRFILETQVLAAREGVMPTEPFSPDDPAVVAEAERRIEAERLTDPEYARGTGDRAAVLKEVFDEMRALYRAVEPGRYEEFYFNGLGPAKQRGMPITLRYRIEAEGNPPDVLYDLSFLFPDGEVITRRTGLGFTHTVTLPVNKINDNGTLAVQIYNGQLFPTQRGGVAVRPNGQTMIFPSDGLEITYAAGSYQMNFLRVIFVLWLKLAFLSMIAIWASTFLSFPVACLISFGVFFAAESAGFLADSLDVYGATDSSGDVVYLRAIAVYIAKFISDLFSVYSDLRPTTRLVDGRLLGWSSVAVGTGVLATASGVLYALAVFTFSRRELATYSGK